jgi:hypothetical protein
MVWHWSTEYEGADLHRPFFSFLVVIHHVLTFLSKYWRVPIEYEHALLQLPLFPDTHVVLKSYFKYDFVYFNKFSLVLFKRRSRFLIAKISPRGRDLRIRDSCLITLSSHALRGLRVRTRVISARPFLRYCNMLSWCPALGFSFRSGAMIPCGHRKEDYALMLKKPSHVTRGWYFHGCQYFIRSSCVIKIFKLYRTVFTATVNF